MGQSVSIERFEAAGAAAQAAADRMAGALSEALAARGAASLVVTGGRTPGPVYDRLSRAALDWSRVVVTLSDERWVDETAPDSNARLVRERLLTGPAAAARFVSLKTDAASPEAATTEVELRLASVPWPFDAVLLGMGDDGHVASLFPNSPALAEGMRPDSDRRCVGVPGGPDGAPPPQPRLSLTRAALAASRRLVVLIQGRDKWDALQLALHGQDEMEMPARALFAGAAPVDVLWSA